MVYPQWMASLGVEMLTKISRSMCPLLAAFLIVVPLNVQPANKTDLESADDAETDTSLLTPQETSRLYSSPEERREARLGTWLTDWLKLSGSVELENSVIQERYDGGGKVDNVDEFLGTLQLGFELDVAEYLTAELVLEAEFEGSTQRSKMDEGRVEWEPDDWAIKLGKQYVPFGEYYSHFVTGPQLEFGETNASSLIVEYSFDDRLEISAFILNSKIDGSGSNDEYDWGGSLAYSSDDENISMGISYLSDLAETDERILGKSTTISLNTVSGWNAYVTTGWEHVDFTAEVIQANGSFDELDRAENQPAAYNVELAYLPTNRALYALRVEGSEKLEDQAQRQYGIAGVWQINNNVVISADYLYGKFKKGFVVDEMDVALERQHRLAAQISIEF